MANSLKKWPIPRNREESATSKSPLLAIKAVYIFSKNNFRMENLYMTNIVCKSWKVVKKRNKEKMLFKLVVQSSLEYWNFMFLVFKCGIFA